MATVKRKAGPVGTVRDGSKRVAKEAADSPLVERLARLGYAVKGLIYITIGLAAVRGALGQSSTPADQLGAISAMRKLPYAPVVLWVILVGLLSYSLWEIICAFADPFHKGKDAPGLLARGGYLVSAVTYAFFASPTYDLIKGSASDTQTGRTQKMIAGLMSMPMGRVVVGAFGLAGIAAGIYQIYIGITANFEQQFKPYALSAKQLKVAKQLGRFGTIARGVVLSIVGFFIFLAAYYANPRQAGTFDGALNFLAHQPYGLWLLGIVAAGLIAFGIYSIMSAAWFRLKR